MPHISLQAQTKPLSERVLLFETFLHANLELNEFQRNVLRTVLGRGVVTLDDITDAISQISKMVEYLESNSWVPTRVVGDQVRKPNHYERFPIEPTYFIVTSGGYHWCVENFIKYICRYPFKNGLEDLRKAMRNLEMFHRERDGQKRWSN